MPALDMDAVRSDLPGASDRRVDNCLLATAKGCRLRYGDELFRLHLQQRQRHRPDAVHLQRDAGRIEIAGPEHGGQQRGKVSGDR
jgi:hypothetical protein